LLWAHVIGFAGDDFSFIIDEKAFGFGDPEIG